MESREGKYLQVQGNFNSEPGVTRIARSRDRKIRPCHVSHSLSTSNKPPRLSPRGADFLFDTQPLVTNIVGDPTYERDAN